MSDEQSEANTDWLSTSQAAERVGKSPTWIRAQINNGRLAAMTWRVSGSGRASYRIERSELERFITERQRASDANEGREVT